MKKHVRNIKSTVRKKMSPAGLGGQSPASIYINEFRSYQYEIFNAFDIPYIHDINKHI